MRLPKPLHMLVPTKLALPRSQFSWVARDRLFALLGPRPTTPLTIVVAPAGFGKSTLVAQWLLGAHTRAQSAGQPTAVAWLTLDEHDQDGLTVLTYIAGAIERVLPGALPATLGLIEGGAPLRVVLQALLVDLSALKQPLTLVLDDYYLIEAESVHHSLSYLLRNLPPQCHMVVITRIDPPISLARLRAAQQVRELRAADLRFTLEETAALLTALRGAPPQGSHVAEIHRQTEGWAIALQLSALANLEQPAQDGRLGLAQREIAEYLADEVLARQPDDVQTTLLTLAVPERFCAELLATLLGAPGNLPAAESRIDALLRANLFVIQLDPERRWFRLHQLFRELLMRRLQIARGAGGVRALHGLSARWFAAAGHTEEALGHLLAAGDVQEAATLVERLLPLEGTRSGSNGRLDYWLRKLPLDLAARLPGLALIHAHLAGVTLDLEDMAAALARVDALLDGDAALPPPWPTFHADLAATRAVLYYWQGRPEAARMISQALEQGMMPTLAGRSFLFHGLAMVGLGSSAEDAERVKAALPIALSIPEPEQAAYRCAYLSGMYLLGGELDLVLQEGQHATLITTPINDTLAAYIAFCSGVAAYERAEYQLAAAQFTVAATRKYRVNATTYMAAIVGLALIALAEGSLEAAQGYVQEAMATAEEVGGPFLRHQALAVAVRSALARGDTSTAARLAGRITADIDLGGSIWLEAPRLTRARALIAADEAGALALAEELIAACLREIEPRHNRLLLVRALATRALLRQAQGRQGEARADLRQAVDLGAPRGFVRSFLDLGPALLPPLRELAASGVVAGPLARALVAGPLAPRPIATPPVLPEMLTPRESQILALLARRWSDKEIAEQLVITPNTVRKHTSTIYDKLGVSSRREAVDVASALGLLATT